jgi:hypothetical protein
METVKLSVVMASNFSSEVQQLRIDNETLKTQLRDLQEVPSHVSPTRREVASIAVTTKATAVSCRDVVCAVDGNLMPPRLQLRLGYHYLSSPLCRATNLLMVIL